MCLFAVCVTCCDSFAYTRDYLKSFNLSKVSHSDEASLLFWNWLLNYTQLSVKTANLHDIFEDGSAAVFYDLDGDGVREIIGTHKSTDILHRESCYLYILKYDKSLGEKYRLISGDLYFDISKSLNILNEKSGGYYVIRTKSARNGRNKFFVFDESHMIYVEK